MENSVSKTPMVSFSNHPVKAFLGLKRHQWSQRSQFQTIARSCLESMGATNVLAVSCFLKTGQGTRPSTDPNVITVFLKLRDKTGIELIL